LLKSFVFVGVILGQCTMGIIADHPRVGLNRAMILINLISFVGIMCCTMGPFLYYDDYPDDELTRTTTDQMYWMLAISRGILGFGVGGKYPVASAMRAASAEMEGQPQQQHEDDEEDSKSASSHHRASEVAKGFFWQTPGALLPYVISILLLVVLGDDEQVPPRTRLWQFSLLTGAGAVPVILVLWLTLSSGRQIITIQKRQSHISRAMRHEHEHQAPSSFGDVLKHIISHPNSLRKLMGTGLCWALYDFVYFGTALNLPDLFGRVFGGGERSSSSSGGVGGLTANALQNIVAFSMGFPGVLLAIRHLPFLKPKKLQSYGFIFIGGVSLLLAALFRGDGGGSGEEASTSSSNNSSSSSSSTFTFRAQLQFVLACCLIFSLNWGCNVSSANTA
jgi:MFS family permease